VWSNLLGVILAAATAFQAAVAPYAFHFPRDHAAHDTYQTEWWYFTGHLHTRQGRRFGFELTFFRIGLEPRASSWTRKRLPGMRCIRAMHRSAISTSAQMGGR
jgi:predicted secreted hydrolase